MGRAARNNPVAVKARNGEIQPKEKTLSKKERDRQVAEYVRRLIITEIMEPGTIKRIREMMESEK